MVRCVECGRFDGEDDARGWRAVIGGGFDIGQEGECRVLLRLRSERVRRSVERSTSEESWR
jgi:hypothetical protein